jgi:hypothetical protein
MAIQSVQTKRLYIFAAILSLFPMGLFGWAAWVVTSRNMPKRPGRPQVIYLSAEVSRKATPEAPPLLPSFLLAEVEKLPDRELSLGKWAAELRSKGHRVCCEELPGAVDVSPFTYRLSTEPRPLYQVLDDLVLREPQYNWVWMRGSSIVNIVPQKSRLDEIVESADYRNGRLVDCLSPVWKKSRVAIGSYGMGSRTDPGRVEHWPFAIGATDITARDYLNLLAQQYEGMSWYVDRRGSLYFVVLPQENFERIAQRLRTEERERKRTAAESTKPPLK